MPDKPRVIFGQHPAFAGLGPGTLARASFYSTTKRWQFPSERFVEYEPSDESWCRPLGIGHEMIASKTTVTIPRALVVDDFGGFLALPPEDERLFPWRLSDA